ncbi:somatostatin receptor type 5-like [Triplophysa dalaica]|uniref:somatostatin receptor type 5-like n=1 Tax=Triplophysa dalaica TaxID=1582913 RepID=UPI0024DFAB35|nr:somatostatin receptor type 5-like [Triplophysa dalaica]
MNEEKINVTVNFTSFQAYTNSSFPFGLIESLEICVHIFSLFFGLPTHFYVMWLIITGSRTMPPSEFFILNFSVCEIVSCLNYLAIILSAWVLSLRKVTRFITELVMTGRPLFQCLICVERYLAVVYPVTFLKYKLIRYRVIFAAAAWIMSLGSCLFCMFIAVLQVFVGHSWFLSVQFLVFLSIQLFCCLAVLRALKQSGPGERGREREEENHMKRKAFHLILITTVSMVIAYISYAVLGFFAVMTTQVINAFWLIGLICFVLCGFVQPVLYLKRAGKLNRFFST